MDSDEDEDEDEQEETDDESSGASHNGLSQLYKDTRMHTHALSWLKHSQSASRSMCLLTRTCTHAGTRACT